MRVKVDNYVAASAHAALQEAAQQVGAIAALLADSQTTDSPENVVTMVEAVGSVLVNCTAALCSSLAALQFTVEKRGAS
jgi:hypothetical protein